MRHDTRAIQIETREMKRKQSYLMAAYPALQHERTRTCLCIVSEEKETPNRIVLGKITYTFLRHTREWRMDSAEATELARELGGGEFVGAHWLVLCYIGVHQHKLPAYKLGPV